MAIKGKKKSGSAVRRPAGAPRPQIPVSRARTPWYRTRDGMMIGGIFVLVGLGVIFWLVSSAQDRADERKAEQQVLIDYTDQVQPAIDSVTDPANAMVEVQQLPADEDELKTLQKDATEWASAFQSAQGTLAALPPAATTQATTQLFNEALALYASAANMFAQLPSVEEEDARALIFTNASSQRDLATAVFQSAITGFDVLREQLDLPGSRLTAPTTGTPQDTPTPVMSPAATPGGNGQNDDN